MKYTTHCAGIPTNAHMFFCIFFGFTQIPINEHATTSVVRYQHVAWTNVTMKKALKISVSVGYRTHVDVWQMKLQPEDPYRLSQREQLLPSLCWM